MPWDNISASLLHNYYFVSALSDAPFEKVDTADLRRKAFRL